MTVNKLRQTDSFIPMIPVEDVGELVSLKRSRHMTLHEWLQHYFLERTLARKSQKNLCDTVRLFGDRARLSDIDEPSLNRWLVEMLQRYSPGTVKRLRGDMLSLLNAAADADEMPRIEARRIRKPAVRVEYPEASDAEEIAKLYEACASLRGEFTCGIERPLIMRAWILVAWDCCFRPWSDQLTFRFSHIREDDVVWFQQPKTNYPKSVRLRPETRKAIDATIPPDRDFVFPVSRSSVGRAWDHLREISGVQIPPKQLRSSRATIEEKMNPGGAPRILGHKPGSTVAYKHYVNPLMSQPEPELPPPLLKGVKR